MNDTWQAIYQYSLLEKHYNKIAKSFWVSAVEDEEANEQLAELEIKLNMLKELIYTERGVVKGD